MSMNVHACGWMDVLSQVTFSTYHPSLIITVQPSSTLQNKQQYCYLAYRDKGRGDVETETSCWALNPAALKRVWMTGQTSSNTFRALF